MRARSCLRRRGRFVGRRAGDVIVVFLGAVPGKTRVRADFDAARGLHREGREGLPVAQRVTVCLVIVHRARKIKP